MKLLVIFTLIGFCHSASLEERHFFSSGNKDARTHAVSGNEVSARPVEIGPNSAGKKIKLTITKEFVKQEGQHVEFNDQDSQNHHAGHHDAHQQAGHHDAHQQAGHHDAHQQAGHHDIHQHAGHHDIHHLLHDLQAAQGQVPIGIGLNLADQQQGVTIDNSTLQDLLQNFLAGNIQNGQINANNLMHGKKPVAVIFSSAVHVVDLGDLQAIPGPQPMSASILQVHENDDHNASTHQKTANRSRLNASSIFNMLISPLQSLANIGRPALAPAPQVAPVVQPVAHAQQVQMQPILLMVPVSQLTAVQQSALSTPQFVNAAQVQQVLDGLMNTTLQMLNSTAQAIDQSDLAASHDTHTANHAQHAHSAHATNTQAASVVAPSPTPVKVVPIVAPATHFVKKVNLSASLTKDKFSRDTPLLTTERPETTTAEVTSEAPK